MFLYYWLLYWEVLCVLLDLPLHPLGRFLGCPLRLYQLFGCSLKLDIVLAHVHKRILSHELPSFLVDFIQSEFVREVWIIPEVGIWRKQVQENSVNSWNKKEIIFIIIYFPIVNI